MSNQEWRNYEENVHIYLGFLRKKDNPNEGARCIRRIAKSEQDILILKRECAIIGGNWRIHRTVNKRSTKKAFKKLQHYLIDNPDCAPYLDSIWKTILLQPECRAEKKFMLDVDFQDEDRLAVLKQILYDHEIEIESWAKTPQGYHYITKPFDRRILAGYGHVTLLTDGYIFEGLA